MRTMRLVALGGLFCLGLASCNDSNGGSDGGVLHEASADLPHGDGARADGAHGDLNTNHDGGSKTAWGWIAAIEQSLGRGTEGMVQAHFATNVHYTRTLPHQLDKLLDKRETVGSCTRYGVAAAMSLCMPPCNENQTCEPRGDAAWAAADDSGIGGAPPDFVCRPIPGIWSAGTVTLTGLKVPVTLEPDSSKLYIASGMPADLFDPGATITATASGGELAPFSLTAKGVAPLVVDSTALVLRRGTPLTVSWTKLTTADAAVHVQVVLRAGIHDPALPSGAIVCDVEDSAGKMEIASSLVDGFLGQGFLLIQKSSWVTRYTRQEIKPFGQPIELFVGNAVEVTLSVP